MTQKRQPPAKAAGGEALEGFPATKYAESSSPESKPPEPGEVMPWRR
jgi:hypothetical protein